MKKLCKNVAQNTGEKRLSCYFLPLEKMFMGRVIKNILEVESNLKGKNYKIASL